MVDAVQRKGLQEQEENAPASQAALVLSGGGARAAYQAGVLDYIGDAFPEARFPILTGVSAGAINAAHLANHTGTFTAATDRLVSTWKEITTADVFEAESNVSFLWDLVRASYGRRPSAAAVQADHAYEHYGLVNTVPLRALLREQLRAPNGELAGVDMNLRRGTLKAFAVVTTNYATGQTVTWVQGAGAPRWERPNRVSVQATLEVEHVMASTALPLIFPAVRLNGAWYGDGGIRLAAPLAPAVHLGADRILAISTRYDRSRAEADVPAVRGYPPTAQIIGMLLNAVFLDALEQDARMLRRINRLVEDVPPHRRNGMRPIRLLEIRPSVDIGRLAGAHSVEMPGPLSLLMRGLGVRETDSPDWLSMLLFEPAFLERLVEIGYHDARRQHGDLEAFLSGEL